MHAARTLLAQPWREPASPAHARASIVSPSQWTGDATGGFATDACHTHAHTLTHTHADASVRHSTLTEPLLVRGFILGPLPTACAPTDALHATTFVQRAICGSDLSAVTHVRVCVDTTDTPADILGKALPNCTHLTLDGSILTSLRDLGTSLRSLRVLSVCRCGLTDLDGITGVPALTHVRVCGNPVQDLTPLALNDTLEMLDASDTAVDDETALATLATCPALHTLSLLGSPLAARADYCTLVAQYLPQLKFLDGRRCGGASDAAAGGDCSGGSPGSESAPARGGRLDDALFSASMSTISMSTSGPRASSAYSTSVSIEASSEAYEDVDSGAPSPALERPTLHTAGYPALRRPGTAPVARGSGPAAGPIAAVHALRPASSYAPAGDVSATMLPSAAPTTSRANSSSTLTHGEHGIVFAGPAALAMRRRRMSQQLPPNPSESDAPDMGLATNASFDASFALDRSLQSTAGAVLRESADLTASSRQLSSESHIVLPSSPRHRAAGASSAATTERKPRTSLVRPSTAGATHSRPGARSSIASRVDHAALRAALQPALDKFTRESSERTLAQCESRGVLAPRINDGVATFVIPSITDFSGEEDDSGSEAKCDDGMADVMDDVASLQPPRSLEVASSARSEAAASNTSASAAGHAAVRETSSTKPSATPSHTIDCCASSAADLSDAELIRLLRHKPKEVVQLHTRESFTAFFRGISMDRVRMLLRAAYSDLPPAEREARTSRRLHMLEPVLTD